MLKHFLNFIEYKEKDFWKVVDKFANQDVVEKALINGEKVQETSQGDVE